MPDADQVIKQNAEAYRTRYPIFVCAIDGNEWDRNVNPMPPCQHSQAEWDQYFEDNPPPEGQQPQPWKVKDENE
jgi:hypothetical protein